MTGIKDKFKNGYMEMIILTLLNHGDMYGYKLVSSVSKYSDDKITVTYASLYPTLHSMEQKGYISPYKKLIGSKMVRIYYQIEPKGKARLEILWDEFDIFYSGMRSIRSLYR